MADPHQPQSYPLREVPETIRHGYGLRCRLIPVPPLPILWLLFVTEKPGIRLPVTATEIRGLRQGRHDSFASDFGKFGYPARSLAEPDARMTRSPA